MFLIFSVYLPIGYSTDEIARVLASILDDGVIWRIESMRTEDITQYFGFTLP